MGSGGGGVEMCNVCDGIICFVQTAKRVPLISCTTARRNRERKDVVEKAVEDIVIQKWRRPNTAPSRSVSHVVHFFQSIDMR